MNIKRVYIVSVIAFLLAFVYRAFGQECQWIPVSTELNSRAKIFFDSTRHALVSLAGMNDGWTWRFDGTVWIPVTASSPASDIDAVAFDTHRGVAVLCTATHGQTLEWDGIRWERISAGSPGRLRSASMAYDKQNRRTILFGGYNVSEGENKDDTWQFVDNDWSLLTDEGPSARSLSAMAYDTRNEEVMLFGGRNAAWNGDTWKLVDGQWELVGEMSEFQRGKASMAFNESRGVMMLTTFDSSLDVSSTWEWNGKQWIRLLGDEPVGMVPVIVYDDFRNIMYRQTDVLSTWNGQEWVPIEVTKPNERSQSMLVNDPVREVLMLLQPAGDEVEAQTWEWDGHEWALVGTGDVGSWRTADLVYDTTNDRMILVKDSGGIETWFWSEGMWTRFQGQAPTGRLAGAIGFDSSRGVLTTNLWFDELRELQTWEFDGDTWVHRSWEGPDRWFWHDLVYDVQREKMLFYNLGSSETWQWDGDQWTLLATEGGPQGRDIEMYYHPGRGQVVAYGVINSDGGLWSWDGSAWTRDSTVIHRFSEPIMAYDTARSVLVQVSNGYGGIFQEEWPDVGVQIDVGPRDQAVAKGQTAVFLVETSGSGTIRYQWLKDGVALGETDRITGTLSARLTIDRVKASDAGEYSVRIYNGCEAFSQPGMLEVTCLADCNEDGQIDTQDFVCFLNLYNVQDPEADFNQDGIVNILDLIAFFNEYGQVCR